MSKNANIANGGVIGTRRLLPSAAALCAVCECNQLARSRAKGYQNRLFSVTEAFDKFRSSRVSLEGIVENDVPRDFEVRAAEGARAPAAPTVRCRQEAQLHGRHGRLHLPAESAVRGSTHCNIVARRRHRARTYGLCQRGDNGKLTVVCDMSHKTL